MSYSLDDALINMKTDTSDRQPDHKKQLCAYYNKLSDESDYIQATSFIVKEAESFLDTCVSNYRLTAMTYQLAIVLDIDETSLSNYLSIEADDFSNDPIKINERYHKTNSPAIKPVLQLFQKAVENNVSVFFITARKPMDNNPNDDLQAYVVENLSQAGYNGWTRLYMPHVHEFDMPSALFKTNIRKMLTEEGYKIILNVGDQASDFEGGYADKIVQIPNLLYGSAAEKQPLATCHSTLFHKQRVCNQQQYHEETLDRQMQLI